MSVHADDFEIGTRGKGTYEITDHVARIVKQSRVQTGTATVFVQHTSASLIIMENADPTARRDLEEFFERLVPESGRMAFDVAFAGVSVDATRIRSPMLVVAAREDRITPARMVRKIARKYRAELRVYDGHAHMLLLEPGWELIAGEVATWLDKEVR